MLRFELENGHKRTNSKSTRVVCQMRNQLRGNRRDAGQPRDHSKADRWGFLVAWLNFSPAVRPASSQSPPQ
jgi:hypothetical protein